MERKEQKICQNCKQSFNINGQDFKFYEKMGVPVPTFCPECRLVRRMAWRNESTFYNRACNAPGHNESILSIYSPDKSLVVYDQKYWWSDAWDALDYGRDFDFSRNFFEQFIDLLRIVPLPNFDSGSLGTVINSQYCNDVWEVKNCYVCVTVGRSEDCLYCNWVVSSKRMMDCLYTKESENCYECIDCRKCYNVSFSQYAQGCIDSFFLFDCKDCINCFGCVGLRHKQYYIFNKPYAKEEYYRKLGELKKKNIQKVKKEFADFVLKFPRRFAYIVNSQNVTGDNIQNSKNCMSCFDTSEAQDSKFLSRNILGTKDCQDLYSAGEKTELSYDTAVTGINTSRVLFSDYVVTGHNIEYSLNTNSSSNIFGCVSVRHKQYCILNKQYSKESFNKLRSKIVRHMSKNPYTDKKGRVYKYGEFFPGELSPFEYNETIAQECFPLSHADAISFGYGRRDVNKKSTLETNENVIECRHKGKCDERCTRVFRLISQERTFYEQMRLPIPEYCPNCRHYQRLRKRNPFKLWKRGCSCAGKSSENSLYENVSSHFHKQEHCPNIFQTTYALDRPEIVYCEQCYLAEVA